VEATNINFPYETLLLLDAGVKQVLFQQLAIDRWNAMAAGLLLRMRRGKWDTAIEECRPL